MSAPAPSIPAGTPAAAIPADPSLWDRISTWASENKAVVYTIAGVAVVVTGAGVAYYLNTNLVCIPLFVKLFNLSHVVKPLHRPRTSTHRVLDITAEF